MISADVVHVVVDNAGGDPFWLTLLGNGGVGIFLGAMVGVLVARAGRGREDRKEWRELRHERYSAILINLDDALGRLQTTVNGRDWRTPIDGDDVTWMMGDIQMIRADRQSIRLMGHGPVFDIMNRISWQWQNAYSEMTGGRAGIPRGAAVQRIWHSDETAVQGLKNIRQDIDRLEETMREQLDIADSDVAKLVKRLRDDPRRG